MACDVLAKCIGRLPALHLVHAVAGWRAQRNWHKKWSMTSHRMSYLVQGPFGVSEEGDAVSLSDADCHSSESGSWGVPHCFSFQRCPAGHWAGGVVGTTGIRLEGILWYMNTTDMLVRWFVLTRNTMFYCCHVEVFIDSLYLSQAGVPRHFPLECQTPNLVVDSGSKASTHCIVLSSQDAKLDYTESLRGKWEICWVFLLFPVFIT